jgi:predicted ATPase
MLVLHRLGRVASQLPLLIAATCRSGTAATDLERLVRSWEKRDAALISLSGLDEVAVANLARHVAGAEPTASLLELAAGNPLYVIELIRATASGPLPQPRYEAAATGLARMPVPGSLISVVTRKLSGLSARTREILPVAAVLGPSFTVAELSAVLATSALHLLAVVQETAAGGVLVAESDRLVFRHDVIRQALYESLPPPRATRCTCRPGRPSPQRERRWNVPPSICWPG